MIWNIAAAMLVAGLLRCFRLGAQSLWIDEVFTWYGADIGRPMPLATLLENVHGPLYSLMLHLWGGVAGDSEWALRLPSALLGTASVPAFAWLAARWLGRECAVPAAWLTAGSPFLIWYSQEARNYALLFPCVALASVAMLSLRERLSFGGFAGWVAAWAAGLLTNLSCVLLAPLHLYWWMSARHDRRRRLWVVAVSALVLLAVLSPWLPRLASVWDWKRLDPAGPSSTEALRGGPAISPGAYPFTLHAFAVGYTLGPGIREIRTRGGGRALRSHLPELLVVGLLFAGLGVLAVRAAARRRVVLVALLALMVPVLLVSYGALQNFKVYHPRYVAVAFPFVIALLAAGLADAKPRLRAVLALALALVWGLSLHHHYFVPGYGKEDMRNAAAIVKARAGPGDRIIAAGADDVLIYYYRGPLRVERYWLGWAANPDRMALKLEAARAGARNLWVVWSRGEDLDPEGRFLRHLQTRYPAAETFETEGVKVWRLPGTANPAGTGG
ncbi:MAG: glycosyltransferase family 39 protein [Candidatus Eisenbacteria bacterium]